MPTAMLRTDRDDESGNPSMLYAVKQYDILARSERKRGMHRERCTKGGK
jgi:hypothetical protein